MKKSIQFVSDSYLCTSCGACVAVCPKNAIDFEENLAGYFFPRVNSGNCIDCGICVDVCSGLGLAANLCNRIPSNPFVGHIDKCLSGYALDPSVYNNSQSGGIVTGILANQMKLNKIESVIVVKMGSGRVSRPELFVAKNLEDLKRGQKSKYCPAPILTLFKEVSKSEGKFAFVGTGCQVHGLLNVLERFPKLKEKLAFTIGLLCDRIMTYEGVDYLVKCSPVRGFVDDFAFRDKSTSGYPGDVMIKDSEGRVSNLPARNRIRIKNFFTPVRCRLCFDKMNIFADVSVGDPHGVKKMLKPDGETIVFVRTNTGNDLINDLIVSGEAIFQEVDVNEGIMGQKIERKKREWLFFSRSWMKFGGVSPNYFSMVAGTIDEGTIDINKWYGFNKDMKPKGSMVKVLVLIKVISDKLSRIIKSIY